MQVAFAEVHNSFAVRAFDIGISNVPLSRHGPIENRRSGGYLYGSQWNPALNQAQGSPDSFTGNTSADRVKLCRESVQFLADLRDIPLIEFLEEHKRASI
jgi:hypothetical protein